MSAAPLWTSGAMAAAMRAASRGALPEAVTGLSIDSRSIAPGEAYFAIKGDVHDGHDFVAAALKAGAALAVVEAAQRDKFAADAPLLVVDDVLAGLVDLAHAARARLDGAGDRGDRLGRQDLDQGGAAARARRAGRDPCLGRVLQQSLGRAAVAGALPGRGALCDLRDRHESRRRDRAAGQDGAAAGRHHHHGRAGASGVLRRHRGDCRRQGGDLCRRRARRRGGAQPRQCAIRPAAAACQETRHLAHRLVRRRREMPTRGCSTCRCTPPARRCMPTSSATTSPTSSACRAVTWR